MLRHFEGPFRNAPRITRLFTTQTTFVLSSTRRMMTWIVRDSNDLVNKEEQSVLSMLFWSIMWRCDPAEPGINRKVFLQFFALPVSADLLFLRDSGARLFSTASIKTRMVSWVRENSQPAWVRPSLISRICIRATYEEKLKFLFSLFDVDTDGFITQNELILMVEFRSSKLSSLTSPHLSIFRSCQKERLIQNSLPSSLRLDS